MSNDREVGHGACPDPELLAGLALGEAVSADRRALADHVVGCRRCAADFRLLRELHGEAQRPARRRRFWGGLAAAAAVVIVAVAGLWPRGGEIATRGPGFATRPVDGAVLAAPPRQLEWPAQLGARRYRVTLHRGDGTRLWEAPPVDDPRLEIPTEVVTALAPGRSGYWVVDVEGPVRRQRLGPFWFEVGPRDP
jgi:hypothetical protein